MLADFVYNVVMRSLLLLAVVALGGCASHNPPVSQLDPATFQANCEWNGIQQQLLIADLQTNSTPDRQRWAKNNLWALRSTCGQK